MKKFALLSIALVSLSLVSCREQEDMVQMNGQEKMEIPTAAASTTVVDTYGTFDSSLAEDGDPVKPPKD